MTSVSDILTQGYQQFILRVEGKEEAIPYRINIPPNEHPARQGESAPEVILKQLHEDAKKQKFDLKSASAEEIRDFMRKNLLGIDCSGFVYRTLDYLLEGLNMENLQTSCGLEHVGRTNSATLTSEPVAFAISDLKYAEPGDLIRLASSEGIHHCLIILQKQGDMLTYAHSSGITNPDGLERAYRAYNAAFPEVPYPNTEGVKTLLDDMAPRDKKAGAADPRNFVDMSLVQELEASGFIKQLYKR